MPDVGHSSDSILAHQNARSLGSSRQSHRSDDAGVEDGGGLGYLSILETLEGFPESLRMEVSYASTLQVIGVRATVRLRQAAPSTASPERAHNRMTITVVPGFEQLRELSSLLCLLSCVLIHVLATSSPVRLQ